MSSDTITLQRVELHKILIQNQTFRSCANCEHWNATHNGCELYKATPPVDVIVFGCNDHNFMIPF